MAAELYELRNGTITVKLTNFGATITSLLVPDANGDEFLTLFPSRSSSLPHKDLVFFSDVITRSWFFCSVLMGFRQARGCGPWFRYRRAVSSKIFFFSFSFFCEYDHCFLGFGFYFKIRKKVCLFFGGVFELFLFFEVMVERDFVGILCNILDEKSNIFINHETGLFFFEVLHIPYSSFLAISSHLCSMTNRVCG